MAEKHRKVTVSEEKCHKDSSPSLKGTSYHTVPKKKEDEDSRNYAYSSNYDISFPGESVVELFYGNIDAILG